MIYVWLTATGSRTHSCYRCRWLWLQFLPCMYCASDHTLQSKCCDILKMATSKKIKVPEKCRFFKEDGQKIIFSSKSMGNVHAYLWGCMKNANLELHSISKQAKLNELSRQMSRIKPVHFCRVCSLHKPLSQGLVTDKFIEANYALSQLIAQKLRPHVRGEFVKESMVATAELLEPEKIKLFQSVSLSRRIISDRIIVMSQDIEKNTEGFWIYFPDFLSG